MNSLVENELNANDVYIKEAIDDSGNFFKAIGIGTNNPLKTLHVNGDILYTEEQFKLLDGIAYSLTDSIFDRRKLLLDEDDANTYYGEIEKENHTDENGDYYTYEGSFSVANLSSIVHYLPHIETTNGVDYYKGQSTIGFRINNAYVPGIYSSGANLNLGVLNENPLMNLNQLGVDLYSVVHWKTQVDETKIVYIDVDDGNGGTTQVPDPDYINTLKNADNLEASDFKEMMAFLKRLMEEIKDSDSGGGSGMDFWQWLGIILSVVGIGVTLTDWAFKTKCGKATALLDVIKTGADVVDGISKALDSKPSQEEMLRKLINYLDKRARHFQLHYDDEDDDDSMAYILIGHEAKVEIERDVLGFETSRSYTQSEEFKNNRYPPISNGENNENNLRILFNSKALFTDGVYFSKWTQIKFGNYDETRDPDKVFQTEWSLYDVYDLFLTVNQLHITDTSAFNTNGGYSWNGRINNPTHQKYMGIGFYISYWLLYYTCVSRRSFRYTY